MKELEQIPLHLLRTFVVFCESQNMTHAALSLGISQPAVSLQLRQLEKLVSYALFVVRGRRRVLSSHGAVLRDALRPILAQIPHALRRAENFADDPANIRIIVGARKELFRRLASLGTFRGKIRFVDLSGLEAVERLTSQDIDLAVTHLRPDVLHFKSRKLFTFGTKLIVHRRWLKEVRSHSQVVETAGFLLRIPWIAYDPNALFIQHWLKHFRIKSSDLMQRAVCPDWESVVHLVAEGIGFAVVPDNVPSDKPGVESFPVPSSIVPPRSYYLLFEKSLGKQKEVARLMEHWGTSMA